MKKILMVNDETVTSWNGKQDAISDLAEIRQNASLGKTASEKIGNHTVEKDVPSNAVFTDTIYDDTTISNRINTVSGSVNTLATSKQDKLVSSGVSQNIKTINGQSVLGSGNIEIQGGGSSYSAGSGITISNDKISVDSTIAGSTSVTSVSNIPVSYRTIIATISANATVSYASLPSNGYEVHMVIRNSGSSTISVILPSSGSYVCTSENTIYIASGKYGEVNTININGIGYVHGISSI